MNKNDKMDTQNLMSNSDRSSQTAPLTITGLPDLPSYNVMARQLQQNGDMTQEDIHALDHMEAYEEQMALFGWVSTDMGKSRVRLSTT